MAILYTLNRRIRLYEGDTKRKEPEDEPVMILLPGSEFKRLELDGKPAFEHLGSGCVLTKVDEAWFDKTTSEYKEG